MICLEARLHHVPSLDAMKHDVKYTDGDRCDMGVRYVSVQ